jgi:hypothetical protein
MPLSTIFTEKEHGLIQVALFLFMNNVKDDKKLLKDLQDLLSKNTKFVNKEGKL